MALNLTSVEVDLLSKGLEQLQEIAVLAFLSLSEVGNGKANDELPRFTAQLDEYLANHISEDLWELLNKEATKREQQPPEAQ